MACLHGPPAPHEQRAQHAQANHHAHYHNDRRNDLRTPTSAQCCAPVSRTNLRLAFTKLLHIGQGPELPPTM